jgi:hypothetical protein
MPMLGRFGGYFEQSGQGVISAISQPGDEGSNSSRRCVESEKHQGSSTVNG